MRIQTLALAAVSSLALPLPRPAPPADLVIWGGPIYTAVDARPKVEAVAVSHGRIAYAGGKAGAQGLVGPKTQVIDLKGAALFPGFTDSHAHLGEIGQRELTLNLEGSKSAAEVSQRLKAYVAEHPGVRMIDGVGWIETGWPEGRFLERGDLDAVAPDLPVILQRADGHAMTANTAALKAAGLDETTPVPAGGQILKGPDGQPNGMLVDNAMRLVGSIRKAPTREERLAAYRAAFKVETAYGWTGIHYMSVPWADVPLLEEMDKSGEASLRVYNMIDAAQAGPCSRAGRASPRTAGSPPVA